MSGRHHRLVRGDVHVDSCNHNTIRRATAVVAMGQGRQTRLLEVSDHRSRHEHHAEACAKLCSRSESAQCTCQSQASSSTQTMLREVRPTHARKNDNGRGLAQRVLRLPFRFLSSWLEVPSVPLPLCGVFFAGDFEVAPCGAVASGGLRNEVERLPARLPQRATLCVCGASWTTTRTARGRSAAEPLERDQGC